MTRTGFHLFSVMLLLVGCSSNPPKNDQLVEALERIEELRAEVPQPKPGLRRVPVKRAEAWLARPLAARYRNLRADQAFRLIAQGRPVRFNFPTAAVPVVRWPPQARTIRQHMDSISAQADWWYEVRPDVIQVHDIETRHFLLSAQPGRTEAKLGLRNLAGGASDSSADNAAELALDPYSEEVVQAVEGVLGLGGDSAEGEGGASTPAADPRTRVTVTPSANQLIVTARPHAMRAVERVMERYNESSASIVRIALSILEVEFADAERHELLVRLLRASSNLPLSLVLSATGSTDAAGIGPVQPDDFTQGVTDGGSRYIGSSVVYEWLQTFGNASIAYDDTIEVQNNRMASVDATRTERYVSKISIESVGSDGSTVTPEIEFEELRTGLVLFLQPTVVGDRITLRMGISRSTPVGRVPYAFLGISGTNFITEDFNRVLSVSLADGVPKLLSSFSETAVRDKRSKIPFLGPFGTGRDRTDRRRETVMLITAHKVEI